MENAWRDRYYELENTLENVIRAAQIEMMKFEAGKNDAAQFQISKVTRSKNLGADYIHCVASGINLEFSFEFMVGDEQVHLVPFQRSNSVPVELGTSKKATSCKVCVRENAGANARSILESKIGL